MAKKRYEEVIVNDGSRLPNLSGYIVAGDRTVGTGRILILERPEQPTATRKSRTKSNAKPRAEAVEGHA